MVTKFWSGVGEFRTMANDSDGNEWIVKSWHDKGSKWGWITTLHDPQGNQIGTADYSWKKAEAMQDHNFMINKLEGIFGYYKSLERSP